MDFPLTIHDNHLCLGLASGDWLVDTGSPMSLGEVAVEIGNATHPVARNFLGFSVEKLREWVSDRYVGLIGVDILNRYVVDFDLPGRRVGFLVGLPNETPEQRVSIELVTGGIPMLEADVEGRGRQRLIFDTGAQYSYLNDIAPGEAERIGRGMDFHPMLGRYPIEFFIKRLKVGSLDQDLQFTTRATVSQMCKLLGAQGILGLEPLRTHRAVYNPKGREMWI